MILPNFVIIGGVRCGTTSLYMYLKRHPEIFLSRLKEPCFLLYEDRPVPEFSSQTVTRLEDYGALFADAHDARAIGEASALCLYEWTVAIPNIDRHLPDARLIAILRNPMERACSQYVMARREGAEPLDDFADALAAENERVRDGAAPIFHYTRQSYYHQAVEAYLRAFGPERTRFYRFSRFTESPGDILADACHFLGVDASMSLDAWRVHNPSLPPRRRRLHKALEQPSVVTRTLSRAVPRPARRFLRSKLLRSSRTKPTLRPDLRRELAGVFREDVGELSELLGRDFSSWLE